MLYCTLCGVSIARFPPNDEWLQDIRAVWVEHGNLEDVKLSGIGVCDELNQATTCSFPIGSLKRYDDLDPGPMIDISLAGPNIEEHVYPGTTRFQPAPFCGWGFHSSCWEILNQGFKPNLRHLFEISLSTPCTLEGIMDWGHTYEGAATVHITQFMPTLYTSFPGPHPIPRDFTSDPFRIPGLLKGIKNSYRLQKDPFQSNLSLDPRRQWQDEFVRLSPEILQRILCLLPTRDVRSLRLASPTLAITALPETFWASRFQHGNEFEHLPEVLDNPPTSWRTLYLSLETWTSGNPHMANRRRVWALTKTMQTTIRQMGHVSCQGTPINSWFEPSVVVRPQGTQHEECWRTASYGILGPEDDFRHGCRVLRARTVSFPHFLYIQCICVSFVYTGGGSFVSGILFVDQHGEKHALGYIHDGQEVMIQLPAPERIRGWEVAFEWGGVRAIAAVTENGTTSSWAGEPADFPKWHLAEAEGISAVKAEFDAFKMVSLSRNTVRGPPTEDDWRNSCLWHPSVPPEKLLYNGISGDRPPSDAASDFPVCTVFFGGFGGEELSDLIEVVVWTFDIDYVAGIQFIYTDPSRNRHLGRLGPFLDEHVQRHNPDPVDHRTSLTINGPGGEEITSIVVQRNGNGDLVGLTILTNFDRQLITPEYPFTQDQEDWVAVHPAGSKVIGMFCQRVS
ncbi:hypothetical protein B0I35DRAFT_359355 [Stachybotrys elegans]|uniref:DUF7600 domain-containing protein n=1 Tax=Stachybotrys elegans TaxID=80388 RepID=A0A8K0SMN5_9HYPO|nr:hypothetical protein B0I35DRAFT_359355 [Stachybotrys elegans]